jgi:hypothetical protein
MTYSKYGVDGMSEDSRPLNSDYTWRRVRQPLILWKDDLRPVQALCILMATYKRRMSSPVFRWKFFYMRRTL